MPNAAPRPCAYPGCPELVKAGRCEKHRLEESETYPRDPRVKALYNSVRWQQIRVMQLAGQPWCEECLKQNVYEPATDVDHIKRHQGYEIDFYRGPFQSLCHSCHSKKTAQERGGQ